jgi:hypothetical protein
MLQLRNGGSRKGCTIKQCSLSSALLKKCVIEQRLPSQLYHEKSEILLNYISLYNILYYKGKFVYSSTGHNYNGVHFNRTFLKVSQISLVNPDLDSLF